MPSSEFDLIRLIQSRATAHHAHVTLGIGDDAALLRFSADDACVIASDMLVEGRHFDDKLSAFDIGHKCLAVNLSDLAAMGAEPVAATLAWSLPELDAAWLTGFLDGFFSLATAHDTALIGGDTTRSEQRTICVTVIGKVPHGKALTRHGACAGDDVWVSGHLGGAAYALSHWSAASSDSQRRLQRPSPRLALGQALRGVATACLDLSDGLAGDIQHILHASHIGATLSLPSIPMHPDLQPLPVAEAWRLAMTGGDDYELCFTAPPHQRDALRAISAQLQVPLTRIGGIETGSGLCLLDAEGGQAAPSWQGYDHFANA